MQEEHVLAIGLAGAAAVGLINILSYRIPTGACNAQSCPDPGVCVLDPTTGVTNCECLSPNVEVGGVCTPPNPCNDVTCPSPATCVGTDCQCLPPNGIVNGVCTAPGACTTATCPAPAVCQGNNCVCLAPNTIVGGVCTAPSGCNATNCLSPNVCQNGVCICPSPYVILGGVCVPPHGCDNVNCPPPAVCNSNGHCTCPAPNTIIGGVCTPPPACDSTTCPPPGVCDSSGTCTCPSPNVIVGGVCTAPCGCNATNCVAPAVCQTNPCTCACLSPNVLKNGVCTPPGTSGQAMGILLADQGLADFWKIHAQTGDYVNFHLPNVNLGVAAKASHKAVTTGQASEVAGAIAAIKANHFTYFDLNYEVPISTPLATVLAFVTSVHQQCQAQGIPLVFAPTGAMLHDLATKGQLGQFVGKCEGWMYQLQRIQGLAGWTAEAAHDIALLRGLAHWPMGILVQVSVNPPSNNKNLLTAQQVEADIAALLAAVTPDMLKVYVIQSLQPNIQVEEQVLAHYRP